nr:chemotaxis protein CheW [Salinibacter ruber]
MREPDSQTEDVRQFVSFIVAEEEFGVDILTVQEIIRPVEITRVPHAPDFVEGVINLRGRILPIIDLRTRLGFPERDQDEDTRILVVELQDQTVGFVTDSVREVLRVEESTIEPAPDLIRTSCGAWRSSMSGSSSCWTWTASSPTRRPRPCRAWRKTKPARPLHKASRHDQSSQALSKSLSGRRP